MARRAKKIKTAASGSTQAHFSDQTSLEPPDRAVWPGWVEMESEPAFFNTMLKDMNVKGVKVQEVYGLDDEMLAILPQPVHALIFLFRYRETDNNETDDACPKHVWFARQVPDFACATVALLNIVNNIPGLHMGDELRNFKDFTQDMDPLSRGDAIDDFQFVKVLHNSFARENDLLVADMHLKEKAAKARRRQAVAKAVKTKAEKAALKALSREETASEETAPARLSGRLKRPAPRNAEILAHQSKLAEVRLSNGANGHRIAKPKPKEDPDNGYFAQNDTKKPTNTRRSQRKSNPPKDSYVDNDTDESRQEGFHFCAYIPIKGHVWKLDGLDSAPQDMGPYDAEDGSTWMNLAQPVLQNRVAQYEAGAIEFNLMAVVHDPVVVRSEQLCGNIKALQAIEKKLSGVVEDWRELELGETQSGVITGMSEEFVLTPADIEKAKLAPCLAEKLEKEEDLLGLLDLRRETIAQQLLLKASFRDESEVSSRDAEKAKHRRHDYGKFVRQWMAALAENETLGELLEA